MRLLSLWQNLIGSPILHSAYKLWDIQAVFYWLSSDLVRVMTGDSWVEAGHTLIGIRNQELSVGGEYHALIQPHIIP